MNALKFIIGLFLFVCLLSGVANAQCDCPDGTKSVTFKQEWLYFQPVYCDGELADMLTGNATASGVRHYVDGILKWANYKNRGNVTSEWTGEVFKLRETDQREIYSEGKVTWHWNLKGNMGSHYVGSASWDYINDIITIHKSICVGSKK